jgi:hypothetical protein
MCLYAYVQTTNLFKEAMEEFLDFTKDQFDTADKVREWYPMAIIPWISDLRLLVGEAIRWHENTYA